jgi:hypothetical protein
MEVVAQLCRLLSDPSGDGKYLHKGMRFDFVQVLIQRHTEREPPFFEGEGDFPKGNIADGYRLSGPLKLIEGLSLSRA